MKRVGHKGADAIVQGNSLASFDAALAAGVDMIEFDVLPHGASERLVLAHDPHDAAGRDAPSLSEGLAHLAGPAFAGLEFDVDLKAPGYEVAVVDALHEHGLVERSLVSSQYPGSLAVVRAREPALRLGWSVPRIRRDPFRSPATILPALAALQAYRRVLPIRAAALIAARRCDAVMAHWRVTTPALARTVAAAGGELYVWTVDDRRRIGALEALGVAGVITNDPRLFAGRRAPTA